MFVSLILLTAACTDPSYKRSLISNFNEDGTKTLGPLTDEPIQDGAVPVVSRPETSNPTIPVDPTLPITGGETGSGPSTGDSNGSEDTSGSTGVIAPTAPVVGATPVIVPPTETTPPALPDAEPVLPGEPVITPPTDPTPPSVPEEEAPASPDEPEDTTTEDQTIPEVTTSPICPNSIPSDVSLRGEVVEDTGASYTYKLSVKNNSTAAWDFTMCFYFNHKVLSPKNANYAGTQPHWKLWSKKKLQKGKVRLIEWSATPGNVGSDEIRAINFIKTKNATCPLFPNYCE